MSRKNCQQKGFACYYFIDETFYLMLMIQLNAHKRLYKSWSTLLYKILLFAILQYVFLIQLYATHL